MAAEGWVPEGPHCPQLGPRWVQAARGTAAPGNATVLGACAPQCVSEGLWTRPVSRAGARSPGTEHTGCCRAASLSFQKSTCLPFTPRWWLKWTLYFLSPPPRGREKAVNPARAVSGPPQGWKTCTGSDFLGWGLNLLVDFSRLNMCFSGVSCVAHIKDTQGREPWSCPRGPERPCPWRCGTWP